jgi:nucleoside-diphosphate-sugar epimerase
MALKTVLVTGGAGYVGSVLVPRLIQAGYNVKVLDLYLYGENVLDSVKDSPNLEQIKGDLRDQALLNRSLAGCDAVIHLACISNDPSFELNPDLGRSINFDAFEPLVKISKQKSVKRFIYASSSSVYGISDEPEVTEDHPLKPMTDYSKYKALCEPILLSEQADDFTTVVIRPATVCGYSPRQRLDLSVNILTNHAVNNRIIKVFGGSQQRPNLHIEDMVDLYLKLLKEPDQRIAGKIFNAGFQNLPIAKIATVVQSVVEQEMPEKRPLEIITTATDDLRSYHISSDKIGRELGFVAHRTIENAVSDLCHAFKAGKLPDSMTHSRYFNIKKMQEVELH